MQSRKSAYYSKPAAEIESYETNESEPKETTADSLSTRTTAATTAAAATTTAPAAESVQKKYDGNYTMSDIEGDLGEMSNHFCFSSDGIYIGGNTRGYGFVQGTYEIQTVRL